MDRLEGFEAGLYGVVDASAVYRYKIGMKISEALSDALLLLSKEDTDGAVRKLKDCNMMVVRDLIQDTEKDITAHVMDYFFPEVKSND